MRRKRVPLVTNDDPALVRVRSVPVETRSLRHVPPELFETFGDLGEAEGAILWLEPPSDATAEEVAYHKKRLLAAGALRVQVLAPARLAEDVPAAPLAKAGPAGATARSAALELVEGVEPEIRGETRALVEALLAEAGL